MNQQTTRPQTATEILKLAGNTLGERGKQYDPAGKQERSMTAIVAAFNAIYPRNPLTVHMGWQFMSLVKMVRGATKPHADSALDQVAYAALAAEEVAEALHQPAALCEDEGCPHYGAPHVCVTSVETPAQHNTNFYFDKTNGCIAANESMTAKFQAERKANVAMHEEVTRLRNKVQDLADPAEYRDKRNAELCAELETQRGKCIAQSSRISELQTLVDNLRSSLAQATKECEATCIELAGSTAAMRSAQEQVTRLKAEATEARKRGSAGYNKQVAIQAELKQRNKELEDKVQSLNNEVEAKVRELMSNMRHEAPCAHNTDEPKAPRPEYVDPFDQYGDIRSPMHRLVGDRDPARGGLAYPQGKDAPTPQ